MKKNWMIKNLEEHGITSIVPNGFMDVVDWMIENSDFYCDHPGEHTEYDEINDCGVCLACGAKLYDKPEFPIYYDSQGREHEVF